MPNFLQRKINFWIVVGNSLQPLALPGLRYLHCTSICIPPISIQLSFHLACLQTFMFEIFFFLSFLFLHLYIAFIQVCSLTASSYLIFVAHKQDKQHHMFHKFLEKNTPSCREMSLVMKLGLICFFNLVF